MKTITQIFAAFILFTSIISAQCTRESDFTAIDNPSDYPVAGTGGFYVEIDESKRVLFGDDFATVQGIELRVFLSTTPRLNQEGTELEVTTEQLQDDNGGTDMGDAITGPKSFDVPAGIEIDDFDYIIIQCVQADVLWGRVELGEAIGAGCVVLSAEDITFENFALFPNPATELLSVQGVQGEITELRIFDTTGKEVLTETENPANVNISNLTSGFYFVSVKANNQEITKKLLVK